MAKPTEINLSADKAVAELCRRSLAEFVQEFWGTIIAEELVWSPHMQALCDETEALFRRTFMRFDDRGRKIGRLPKLHDLVINVPPGTSKSTIISVMAPAWAWTNDATLRVIGASYSGDLAVSLAIKSRDIIRSAKFRRYWPHIETKADEDGKTNYKNTAGGQRFSTSTGGASTGEHAHIIIVDDPLNPKQAASTVELESANNWVDTTLSTRKVDKAVTPMLVVMQRLATDDVSGHLLKKRPDTIRKICLPAELSPDVAPASYREIYVDGLLDPVRMPKTVLVETQKTLGAAGYAGQMQQNPIPPGGLIWKKEWFILVDDDVFPSRDVFTQYGTDWDLAYTKDETNAATAFISAGKLGPNIWIDALDWRWLEFPEMVNWMAGRPGPHYIEAKACFVAGTLVRTEAGLKPIETITDSDLVLSFNVEKQLPEYRKVLHTHAFKSLRYSPRLCTFVLSTGHTIKCTENHEFYLGGHWVEAGIIARRVLGMGGRHQPEIHSFDPRPTSDNYLQIPIRHGIAQGDVAGKRCQRLPQDNDQQGWEESYGEASPIDCDSLYSESNGQAGSEPHQQQSGGQPYREPGVGNEVGKSETLGKCESQCGLQEGAETKESSHWIEGSQCYTDRGASSRDSGEVQAPHLHQEDAGRRVRHQLPYDSKRYLWEGVEACEIALSLIVSVRFEELAETVYDLHIEGNHNYCITDQNIIVHNSGKSAKQTLSSRGIIAIEVQVTGGADKVARANMATPTAEAGMVYLRKSLADRLFNDTKQGILQFPRGPYKDLADTLAQCLQRLSKKAGYSAGSAVDDDSDSDWMDLD